MEEPVAACITPDAFACFAETIWAGEIEENLRCKLVFAELVDTRFEKDMKNGCTIKIPFMPDFDPNNIQDVACCEDLTCSPVESYCCDLDIDQWKGDALAICDLVGECTSIDIRKAITERIARQQAEFIDTSIILQLCEELTAATPPPSPCNPEPAAGNQVTAVDLTEDGAELFHAFNCCMLKLDDHCVPHEDRCYVISPKVAAHLRQDPRFTDYRLTGKPAPWCEGRPQTGMWGEFYGSPIYVTNSPAMQNADGTTKIFYLDKSAFVHVRKRTWDVEYHRAEKRFEDILKWAMLFGQKLLYPERACLMNVTLPECE